jgi:hypothetical protein
MLDRCDHIGVSLARVVPSSSSLSHPAKYRQQFFLKMSFAHEFATLKKNLSTTKHVDPFCNATILETHLELNSYSVQQDLQMTNAIKVT